MWIDSGCWRIRVTDALSHIKGVIFDCDGVMVDSENGNRYFYNSILSRLGLAPMTREQEEFAFQATAQEALKTMIPATLHPQVPSLIAEVNYDRDILPRIELMPGFLDFIEEAHKRGLRQAIDTNRTEPGIQRVLDFFNLSNYFNPVMCSTNSEPKPSPKAAEKICTIWQFAPREVIFIGDSKNDRDAAKGAGTIFVAFGNKNLKGDVEVSGYSELARMMWH